jgi:UDPglucose 6-dehydrogenase
VGLATLGHKVIGYDVDIARVELLAKGESPIHEEGLEKAIQQCVASGFLTFTSDRVGLIDFKEEFLFVCVATPQDASGAADLSTVFSVAKDIATYTEAESVIVVKSTVPVGTGSKIQEILGRFDVAVASNPEFLREGTALRDFMEPDRIVVGAQSDAVAQRVLALYSTIDAPKVATSLESAELSKYAANAYLAMRLTFTNDLAELSAKSGARVDDVLGAMGLDSRIGPSFLRPGPGWGGSCFPKDTRALISVAKDFGMNLPLVSATVESNDSAFYRAAESISELAGGSVEGKTIAVWGLAFKAHTDDIRDSPALEIVQILLNRGAFIRAFDPIAVAPSLEGLTQVSSAKEAVQNADVLAVLTEWPEFNNEDADSVSKAMLNSAVFDGRRILSDTWRKAFSNFKALGE